MVRLEGTAIGLLKGNRQFGGGVVDVVAESLCSEVETTSSKIVSDYISQ